MIGTYDQLLDDFHLKYGHYLSVGCAEIPAEVRLLRARLILEEAFETINAMGIDLDINDGGSLPGMTCTRPSNLIEVADGIADLHYVTVGTGRSYGIPTDACFREVHRSNMTKTAPDPNQLSLPGQKYSVKTPKGPNYQPPNLKDILGL